MIGTTYENSNPFLGVNCLEELVLRAESFGIPFSKALSMAIYRVPFLFTDTGLSRNNNHPNYMVWHSESRRFVFFNENGDPIPNPGTFRTIGAHMVPRDTDELFIPNGIERIGNYSFTNYKFRAVSFPESLVEIGLIALKGCTNLRSVHLGGNIWRIGTRAFGESGIEHLEFGSKMFSGNFAFIECRNLKTVHVRNGQTEIFEGMFERCSNLEDVRIPKTVSHIGNHAFVGCFKLKNIVAPKELMGFFTDRKRKVLSSNMIGNPQIKFDFF